MKTKFFLCFLIVFMLSAGFSSFAEEICGKWDILVVADGEYTAQNNIWGANTAQCIDSHFEYFVTLHLDISRIFITFGNASRYG